MPKTNMMKVEIHYDAKRKLWAFKAPITGEEKNSL